MLLTGRFSTVVLTTIKKRVFKSTVCYFSESNTYADHRPSIVHQVYPFSNIKITSNFHVSIRPYDLLDCPDSNLLRISLQSKQQQQQQSMESTSMQQITDFIANFDATIQIDDHNIVIDTIDNLTTHINADELANAVYCLIEVPVKSNLKVSGRRDVNIENMYSDEVNVTALDGDVTTKNIHAIALNLIVQNGNIRCDGTTLAHKTEARSHGKKVGSSSCVDAKQFSLYPLLCVNIYFHFAQNIHFNRILGDSLTAITENGIISTNSCYAENSKFITQKGGLHLKNVHKKSEMYLLDDGDLDVTGFHGILNVNSHNGGALNFQLTEVYGDSIIEAQNPTKMNVNISEFVEQHTCLSIVANRIVLDPTLQHLEKCYRSGDDSGEAELQVGDREMCDDSLTIRTNGSLKLGKLSWMDTVKMKLAAQKTHAK